MTKFHDLVSEQLDVLEKAAASLRALDKDAAAKVDAPDLLADALRREKRKAEALSEARTEAVRDFDLQIEESEHRIKSIEKQIVDAKSKPARSARTRKKKTASPFKEAKSTRSTKESKAKKKASPKRRRAKAKSSKK